MEASEFKAIRVGVGLSQAQAAALLRLGKQAVNFYEVGRNRVPGPVSVLMELLAAGQLPSGALSTAMSVQDGRKNNGRHWKKRKVARQD